MVFHYYVVRVNDRPLVHQNPNLMNDYVDRCPLQGRAFVLDASKVHYYILWRIPDNTVADRRF